MLESLFGRWELLGGLFAQVGWLLAEAEQKAAAPDTTKPEPFAIWVLAIPVVLLLYLIVLRPEQKQVKAQKSMLNAIGKNDRVLTVGGIIGVVVNTQRDIDRITLRIDETNGTTMKITYSAIARVLRDDASSNSN